MLCMKLSKDLYGLLKSALIFYKKLVTELEEMGFEINPYNPCVANCMVNRTQQTVCWHVDDLKVSHIVPATNTWRIGSLAKIYGNKITVSHGKVHDYLGMVLNMSEKGVAGISMIKHLTIFLR